MSTPVVDVAVCVVQTPDGRVLVAERTGRQIAAGFWELPGGKIEPGETPVQAAARELQEETGLVPVDIAPWLSYEHQFPTKRLRLHFCRAHGWRGSPHGREGQRLAWVDARAPHVGPILPSNDRALFALSLPHSYVVADVSPQSRAEDVMAGIRDALSDGATLLRVRLASIAPGQTASLLARVAQLAAAYPLASVFVPSVTDARRAGLAGVHSTARDLRQLTARPATRLWAATCHGEADLIRAVSLGADFAVLSSVLPDSGRPWQTPIGWDGLRRCVSASPIPIYAQGGLTQAHSRQVQDAGAVGLVLACAARLEHRPAAQLADMRA